MSTRTIHLDPSDVFAFSVNAIYCLIPSIYHTVEDLDYPFIHPNQEILPRSYEMADQLSEIKKWKNNIL